MALLPPGRKQFNINKNLESGAGLYQSEHYSKTRFSPDLPLVQKKPNTDTDQILHLKYLLTEKEQQLQKLKQTLSQPTSNIQINPIYPELIVNSAYDSKQCVEIYEDHYKYLSQQMKEKEMKRVEDSLVKQKETQDRLQQMFYIRELEMMEKKKMLEKAEEYRRSLVMQQSFNRDIERERKSRSVTPRNQAFNNRMKFVNAHNILNSPERVPFVRKEQVAPITKNLNRVAVDYSGYKAFQQPHFTKSSPKVQPSYPVIGSNRDLNWSVRGY